MENYFIRCNIRGEDSHDEEQNPKIAALGHGKFLIQARLKVSWNSGRNLSAAERPETRSLVAAPDSRIVEPRLVPFNI